MSSNEMRRLYRSRNDRMIGGLCGGLGQYLGMDSTVVRVLAVVIAFVAPPAILAYLILMLIVPEEPLSAPVAPPAPVGDESDGPQA